MKTLSNYNQDGKCTAVKDHLCRYFAQDPFNRRYQICVYRSEGDCKHSMDLVGELMDGRRDLEA
jgi:hypothetical protein